MYSTCLYCTKNLGANEVIETLPVGRRIAFDGAQGRLWVICRACEKWNLVPFDTRLETIDACERAFRGTRVRFSTDNIGIARLPEGLELVRVGPALRPEFAAWRYGDQFGRRRIKAVAGFGAGLVGVGAFFTVGHAYLLAAGFAPQVFQLGTLAYQRHRVAIRHPGPDGVGGVMTQFDIPKSSVYVSSQESLLSGSWSAVLQMRAIVAGPFVPPLSRRKEVRLRGELAVKAIGKILPRLNGWGGSQRTVRDAVSLVESSRGIDGLMQGAAVHQQHQSMELKYLPRVTRFALEMSAHEDTERAALAGELKLLEREWKEAEELAKIVDDLAISDAVHTEVNSRRS